MSPRDFMGCVVVSLAFCQAASASTLELKSGQKIDGRIIDVSATAVYFQSGQDILNYSYDQILKITSFSEEEVAKGYDHKSAEALAASGGSLFQAEELAARGSSPTGLRKRLRALKVYIQEHFSKDLKDDERDALHSIGEALQKEPPPVPEPRANPTPGDIVKMYAPYQSEFHDKILKVLRRYLDQWISDTHSAELSLQHEERMIERVFGKTRLAVLKSLLPTVESLHESVDRYLKNLDALRAASQVAINAHR